MVWGGWRGCQADSAGRAGLVNSELRSARSGCCVAAGRLSSPWPSGPVRAALSWIAAASLRWRVAYCGLTGLLNATDNGCLKAGVEEGTPVHLVRRTAFLVGRGGTGELPVGSREAAV